MPKRRPDLDRKVLLTLNSGLVKRVKYLAADMESPASEAFRMLIEAGFQHLQAQTTRRAAQ